MVGAQVNVGSSASGVVMHLYVRIGDRVQKGQLLAVLDSRELTARRDADVAALQLAKANLNYAQTTYDASRNSTQRRHCAERVGRWHPAYAVAEQQ